MRAQATARMAPARDRFGGARVASGVAGGVAGAACVFVHFQASPPDPGLRLGEIWLAAVLSGAWAGWTLVGLCLGKGPPWAFVRGVSGAAAGALIFCLSAGLRATVSALAYTRFSDPPELVFFLLARAVAAGEAMAATPAMAAAFAGGLLTVMTGEALYARWRWRGAEVDASGIAVARRGRGPVVRRRARPSTSR